MPLVAKKTGKSDLREFSSNSTSVSAGSAGNAKEHHHTRHSILSPSKSLKFLSPKVTLPVTRSVELSSRGVTPAAPSSSRQSLSTPSPVPMEVDEEELAGDEEMMVYVRRLHARKLASSAKREESEDMLKFPKPIPPKTGLTPPGVLESSQNDYLCEYERKEMTDFPRVFRHPFITAGRRPKIMSPAPTSTRHLFTPSSSTSAITSVRAKPLATLQKSQIGAPMPLSSRIATCASTTTMASVPRTPTSSHTNNPGTASAR
ncbi:hypothetical protein FRC06_000173 [Ceratobasidium sp. 370]|nr:hypothetical protein FRC06_000173 [Ceratobasidium sp. 370]